MEVADVLRSARPEGKGSPPPLVADLRHELVTRRRRRQRRVAGVITAAAVVGLAGRLPLLNPGTVDVVAASGSDPVGSSTDHSSAAPASSGPEEWSILLPTEDWRPESLRSEPVVLSDAYRADELWLGSSDAAPLGPLILATFNPDLDDLDAYEDGPVSYEDVPAGDGSSVRIGRDHGPEALDALVTVGGGSFALQAVGVGQADLVAVAAALQMVGGGPSIAPADSPDGLTILEQPEPEPALVTEVALRRDDGSRLAVQTVPATDWHAVLAARVDAAGADWSNGPDGPSVSFVEADGGSGAALLSGDRLYRFGDPNDAWSTAGPDEAVADGAGPTAGAGPGGQATPGLRGEELEGLLDQLQEWTAEDLEEELGLQPREDVVGGWMDAAELPDDHQLDWLAEGPPLDPAVEAGTVQLWLGCAWVDRWVETGDPSALDAVTGVIDASVPPGDDGPATDPTAADRRRLRELADSARSSTTRSERAGSRLRQFCSDPLGVD